MSRRAGQGLTARVAGWASGVSYAELPPEVKSKALDLVLDWVGCGLSGFGEPAFDLLARVVRRDGLGGGQAVAGERWTATLLGTGEPASPTAAALLNGAAGHALEFDDLYSPGTFHPGTVVIPAALAAAEAVGAGGEEFLSGVVAGYEVGDRLAVAAGPAHYRFWQTTATVGALAAAAAAGRTMGLGTEALADALGSAGTMAAGLWEFNRTGAMSKILQVGRAASSGVLAAELAAAGFSGARTIIEGPQGFLAAMAARRVFDGTGAPDAHSALRAFDDLGGRWTLTEVMTKAYPCCGHTHTAIEAALRLHRKITGVDQVRVAMVRTNSTALSIAGHRSPTSPQEARFSLSYCVAVALARGRVTLADFRGEALTDETVRGLEDRVVVSPDPRFDKSFPRERTAIVEVVLGDGRCLAGRAAVRKGEPTNPMSADDFRSKLTGMLGPVAGEAGTDGLIRAVRSLPETRDLRDWAAGLVRVSHLTEEREHGPADEPS